MKTATLCFLFVLIGVAAAAAQDVTVTANVVLINSAKKNKVRAASHVVLWLTPTGDQSVSSFPVPAASARPRLVQRNKSFEPHILVVPVGSIVEFPNRDPFFHNVFSLFDGKRFDLGLYEAGSTRNVAFDKPGVSYIFCNIHAEMSAVVIAVSTPYYGISDLRGQVTIAGVPAGRYNLHIWYDEASPEALSTMT